MAILDQEKVKIEYIFEGENPTVAPKEERLNTLTDHYEERSPIFIEPIEKINIGIELEPKIIHLTTSLSKEEREEFV